MKTQPINEPTDPNEPKAWKAVQDIIDRLMTLDRNARVRVIKTAEVFLGVESDLH